MLFHYVSPVSFLNLFHNLRCFPVLRCYKFAATNIFVYGSLMQFWPFTQDRLLDMKYWGQTVHVSEDIQYTYCHIAFRTGCARVSLPGNLWEDLSWSHLPFCFSSLGSVGLLGPCCTSNPGVIDSRTGRKRVRVAASSSFPWTRPRWGKKLSVNLTFHMFLNRHFLLIFYRDRNLKGKRRVNENYESDDLNLCF